MTKLAIKSYQEGLISVTERLQAETEYQTVALHYYQLVTQQRMIALDLLISVGNLKLEYLKN